MDVSAYLSSHRWEVPHVAHDGPACHHPEEVAHYVVLGTVPEGISKLRVILKERST